MASQSTKKSPKDLREEGESLREEDKHLEALQVLDKAIIRCHEEKDYETLIDVLKDRTLTFKHLFLQTDDPSFVILARKSAESMLSIAEVFELEHKYSTSYFRLGEIAMIIDDYKSAIDYYEKSLETYSGKLSEKGDFRYHLGEAYYRDGQKEKGKELILEGLREIREGADEWDPFYIHVWESGAHMRLAELLEKDEPEEASKHLKKAKEIAESDEKLVIRRRQIKELEEKLNL